MKQKLLKTLALGLLLTGGVNGAWGDNTVKYSTDGGNNWTDAADLNALSSVFSGATTDIQVQLLGDQTLSSRVTWGKAYTLTITATKNVSINRGSLARSAMWFLNNGTGTLTLGSSDYAITFAGAGHNDNQRIFKNILGNESTGRMNIENVTFENFKFDTENTNLGYLFLNKNNNGKLVLKDVTVSNCITTEDAFIKSVSTHNDNIYLQGTINFNDCKGTDIYAAARIRLGEIDGQSSTTISASNPISIYWANATTAINTPVVVKATAAMVSNFTLTNTDLGLFGDGTDLKLTQAYTLSLGEAGASTLVLPFESKIPADLTCYSLTYSNGDDITASAESTNLAASKAVLVKGTANKKYKFVSTATSGSLATGSGQTNANGVLVGNYEANYHVTEGNYVLQNQSTKGLGFYKVGNGGKTIGANHAYMSVTHSVGGNAPAFFSLDFGGTTGISVLKAVDDMESEGDVKVYSLQGVEMTGDNLPSGIYVKNGKKFIVK